MEKVLITGAAGYIGSVLTPTLLREGYQVVALDSFIYGQHSLLDLVYDKNLEVVRGDARDEELLKKLIADVDWIIPLAGIVGIPACDKDPLLTRTVNLGAIQSILKLRRPEQRILFPNTNSGYGLGQGDIYCDENTPLRPISLYGQTKVAAEEAIMEAGNAIVYRLATAFGISPRMRMDLLVNDFVHRAMKDKSLILFEAHFKRNFIHVRDIAKAFLHGMKNFDKMKNEVYNIGLSNANLSKLELCHEIKKKLPDFVFVESPIGTDPDKRNYIVSNAKIEATGFLPHMFLHDGIDELIRGYRIIRAHRFTNQ